MINSHFMTYALECQRGFLFEKRSKTYEKYVAPPSQEKIMSGAKSDLQERAWLGLESRGA